MPSYKPDPNDSKKQIASFTGNGITRFSHATCPTNEVVTKRPSYVNINHSGSYAFLYETTASAGAVTTGEAYLTGSVLPSVGGAAGCAIKLDINPIAWRRCDAADSVGDVTFVYVRVR
tara:strand:+ start:1599 stop:1952 length:354 start_codon:yes stop_codon:yes gene_type:complete